MSLMIHEFLIGMFSPPGLLILHRHKSKHTFNLHPLISKLLSSRFLNSHWPLPAGFRCVAVVSVKLEHEQLALAGGEAHVGKTRPLILAHVNLPDVVIHHQVGHHGPLLLLLDAVPDTYFSAYNHLMTWTEMKRFKYSIIFNVFYYTWRKVMILRYQSEDCV